jgi:ABC-type nitrate/sulfonate/bicarbonate transport system permease component
VTVTSSNSSIEPPVVRPDLARATAGARAVVVLQKSVAGTTRRLRKLAISSVGVVLAVVVWQVVASEHVFAPSLLPTPGQVVDAARNMAAAGTLWLDIIASVWRVLQGFLLGGLIGLLVGIGTARSRLLQMLVEPLLRLLLPIPTLALVPLAILWFGLGDSSKVFLIGLGVFFPVWVNTHAGVAHVRMDYLRVAQAVGASRAQTLGVILRAAMPTIVAGIRLGIAMAFVLLVAAEETGATNGLGFRLEQAQLFNDAATMFVMIIALGLLGASTDLAFRGLTVRFTHWSRFEQ